MHINAEVALAAGLDFKPCHVEDWKCFAEHDWAFRSPLLTAKQSVFLHLIHLFSLHRKWQAPWLRNTCDLSSLMWVMCLKCTFDGGIKLSDIIEKLFMQFASIGWASASLSFVLCWCLGGCWKLKIVQKLKDLHSQRAAPQKQQMWWDLWSVKWNQICSVSDFSWLQLVWKRLIWTGGCYRLCCSDTWDCLSNNVLCKITLEFWQVLPPKLRLCWQQTVPPFCVVAHHSRKSTNQSGNGSSALRAAGVDLQPFGRTNDDQNGSKWPGENTQDHKCISS